MAARWPSWYQKGTILAIRNLHAAPMPSTKFLLHSTYGSRADNNWRLSRWSPCRPLWIRFWWSCQKFEKLPTDIRMRDGPWSTDLSISCELTIVNLQDGCCGGHRGYYNKIVLAILNLHVAPMPPTKFWFQCLPLSFGSICITIWEQIRFEDFQDGHLGAMLYKYIRTEWF